MIRILTIAALMTSTTFCVSGVYAQGQQSGTAAEREACTPDVYRLCEKAIPDEKRIVECLKKSRKQLSKACEKVLFDDAK